MNGFIDNRLIMQQAAKDGKQVVVVGDPCEKEVPNA